LYPKDLRKLNKKDELLKQRVHIVPAFGEEGSGSSFEINCNLDEKFERHSSVNQERESASPVVEPDEEVEGEAEGEESGVEVPAETEAQDEADNSHEPDEEVKENGKQTNRRRKKRKLFSNTKKVGLTQVKKANQCCLPVSILECTWLENTEANIHLLELKN